MPITSYEARRLRELIRKRIKSEIEMSWKGSRMPDEWDGIESGAELAKVELELHIKEITEK